MQISFYLSSKVDSLDGIRVYLVSSHLSLVIPCNHKVTVTLNVCKMSACCMDNVKFIMVKGLNILA